jgi:hypothetical protein
MSTELIEAMLALFWLAYLGLHLWLLRTPPLEEMPMMTEAKE